MISLFSALARIPKMLSDKAFTDIKAKQARQQAQSKGSQPVFVMSLYGAGWIRTNWLGPGPDTIFVNLCLNPAANQRNKKRKAEEDEESQQAHKLTSKQVWSVCSRWR